MDIAPTEGDRFPAHEIVRFLSGQIHDDTVLAARKWIADGYVEEAVVGAVAAGATWGAGLHPDLATAAVATVRAEGLVASLSAAVASLGTEVAVRYDYRAPSGALDDSLAEAVVAAATERDDILVIWQASRSPLLGASWPPPRPVFVLEVTLDVDAATLAAKLQLALVNAGADRPLVEVRLVGYPATLHEQSAMDAGVVLWAATEPVDLRIAPVFDRVDDDGVGRFDDDHPRLDEPERSQLARYLDSATTIATFFGSLPDWDDGDDDEGVPIDLLTDGEWIWSAATPHYLRTLGMAPSEPFLTHLRRVAHAPPPPLDSLALQRAIDAVYDDDLDGDADSEIGDADSAGYETVGSVQG